MVSASGVFNSWFNYFACGFIGFFESEKGLLTAGRMVFAQLIFGWLAFSLKIGVRLGGMVYESLLDDVYASLPEKKESGERFEAPVAETFLQGNKTYIRNFDFVCSKLRRKPEEVMKFLFKELAIPGLVQEGKLMLYGKISDRLINEKLSLYISTNVICHECGKPDTNIEAHGRGAKVLICEACGARSPVRA